MILCAKCKKKPDSMHSNLCVVKHKYEMTAYCHGATEKQTLSIQALKEAEKPGNDLYFFASSVTPKKRSKVSSDTFDREERVREVKGSEL